MQSLQAHAPEMKAIQKKYKGDRAEAQRRADEVLQGEQHQPGRVVPAAARAVPGLHRAVLHAASTTRTHITGIVAARRPNIADKPRRRTGRATCCSRSTPARRSPRRTSWARRWTRRSGTIMMVLPLVFITVVSRFPTGLVLYWMTTNLWTVGQGLITRRLVPQAGRVRRSARGPEANVAHDPAKDVAAAGNGTPPSRAPAPKPTPQQPRRVKKKKGGAAVTGERRDEVTVEATGETVGEAKWKALRDLERLAPGARQGGGALPGRLGGRARPARRRLHAGPRGRDRRRRAHAARREPARRGREHAEPHVRELVERVVGAMGIGARVDVRETRRGVLVTCSGRRPRPADRQARPDDRCAAVRRERSRAPRGGRQAGDGRRRRVPRPPPRRRSRGSRVRAAERAPAGERVALEPMTPVERKVVHERLKDVAGRADGERGDGAESLRRRPPRLTTLARARCRRDARPDGAPRPRRRAPGAARRLAARRRRSSRAFDGPIVDVGCGGGAPGIPLAHALPEREVVLLEAERRKCAFLERVGAGERARRLGPRRGAGDGLGRRRRREGARAAADRGRVVPAARPAGRRRGALGRPVGRPPIASPRSPSGSPASSTSRAGGLPRAPQDRPDAGRLPAPRRRRARSGRSPEPHAQLRRKSATMRLRCPAPARLSPCDHGLRVCESEGRSRQDDHRDQPRRVPRGGGRARARRRPRPAGERDLRARDARERHVDLRPARRRAARRRSPSRRAFANLFLVPSKPELAGAAVELVAARGRRALPRRRAASTPKASTSSCSTARRRSAR